VNVLSTFLKLFISHNFLQITRAIAALKIYKAMEILFENEITGLPVVDDDIAVVGIIMEKDILKLLSTLENDSATVEDFMTKEAMSFVQDEDLSSQTEVY
jgi:predicted transcriptional regulator